MALAAGGILGAGLGLIAGFIVLDAVAGMVKCQNCGEEMHASKQRAHLKESHAPKSEEGFDIDGMFGSGGIDLPEGW